MLPEKTWKTEAVMRLFLSVLVCFFAGSFVISGLQFAATATRSNVRFYLLLVTSLICLGLTLVMLRRMWRFEDALRRLVVILICFYAGLTLGAWAARIAGPVHPSVSQMTVSALSLQGAVLVLLTPFLYEHGTTWGEAFGLRNRWILAILFGIVVGCIFLPVGWLLQEASAQLMTRVHIKPEQQQVVQTLRLDSAATGRTIFGIISIVLVPPAEETFFRGILYPWIKRAGYPRLALWGTSLVFAAIHSNAMSFIPLTVFAVALTVLYEKTNNLLAPISAHALFNGANLLRLYLLERTFTG